MVDGEKFKSWLAGIAPPKAVEILYVPEYSDCFMLAGMATTLLNEIHWSVTFAELTKQQKPSQDWMVGAPATLQYRANPTGDSAPAQEWSATAIPYSRRSYARSDRMGYR
jgi:hypothetical protein